MTAVHTCDLCNQQELWCWATGRRCIPTQAPKLRLWRAAHSGLLTPAYSAQTAPLVNPIVGVDVQLHWYGQWFMVDPVPIAFRHGPVIQLRA